MRPDDDTGAAGYDIKVVFVGICRPRKAAAWVRKAWAANAIGFEVVTPDGRRMSVDVVQRMAANPVL
jgi:hypothetical protein